MCKYIRPIYAVFCILFICGCATSQVSKRTTILDEKGEKKKVEDIVIEKPEPKLPEYEKLTYQVRWLGLPVGTITASINGIKQIQGRDAYELEVKAKTDGFVEAIYKVDDRFVSYLDVENLYTLRHEVYRREGRYKKDAVTDFDQVNHKAHFKNFLDGSEKDFDIPPGVQDTLSAAYYFRTLSVDVGDKIEYKVCNNESNYELFGMVESKEFIRVPKLGVKEVFHIQPYAKLKGEEVKKGKASGYFSCDKERLPLMAVVQAPLFTEVSVSLYKIEDRQE
jgi:hypothetical protein